MRHHLDLVPRDAKLCWGFLMNLYKMRVALLFRNGHVHKNCLYVERSSYFRDCSVVAVFLIAWRFVLVLIYFRFFRPFLHPEWPFRFKHLVSLWSLMIWEICMNWECLYVQLFDYGHSFVTYFMNFIVLHALVRCCFLICMKVCTWVVEQASQRLLKVLDGPHMTWALVCNQYCVNVMLGFYTAENLNVKNINKQIIIYYYFL